MKGFTLHHLPTSHGKGKKKVTGLPDYRRNCWRRGDQIRKEGCIKSSMTSSRLKRAVVRGMLEAALSTISQLWCELLPWLSSSVKERAARLSRTRSERMGSYGEATLVLFGWCNGTNESSNKLLVPSIPIEICTGIPCGTGDSIIYTYCICICKSKEREKKLTWNGSRHHERPTWDAPRIKDLANGSRHAKQRSYALIGKTFL